MRPVDPLDRRADTHRDGLAGTLDRITRDPRAAPEAERGGEFVGDEVVLGMQPLQARTIAELLGLSDVLAEVAQPRLVRRARGLVQQRAAPSCGRRHC